MRRARRQIRLLKRVTPIPTQRRARRPIPWRATAGGSVLAGLLAARQAAGSLASTGARNSTGQGSGTSAWTRCGACLTNAEGGFMAMGSRRGTLHDADYSSTSACACLCARAEEATRLWRRGHALPRLQWPAAKSWMHESHNLRRRAGMSDLAWQSSRRQLGVAERAWLATAAPRQEVHAHRHHRRIQLCGASLATLSSEQPLANPVLQQARADAAAELEGGAQADPRRVVLEPAVVCPRTLAVSKHTEAR